MKALVHTKWVFVIKTPENTTQWLEVTQGLVQIKQISQILQFDSEFSFNILLVTTSECLNKKPKYI